MLRAATVINAHPTPYEERLIAELRAPSRPVVKVPEPATSWWSPRWLIPVAALLLIFTLPGIKFSASPSKLSGLEFAQFAVKTYKQHEQGALSLDFRSDSQQSVNAWLKSQSPFALALPAAPAVPGEARPYQVEGVRLVRFGGNTAAFVAYHMREMNAHSLRSSDASLLVVPDSVAVASGGVDANFGKVNFHYATVQNYRVVTWSMHGLTYALVSQESNRTQQSCMVCHSEMQDRDLTFTPTPLHDDQLTEPRLQ